MKRRHAQTKWGLISLALMMLVTPLACSGGSDEGQSGEQREGGGEVTRTIVANPEEMQQAFMRVADEVLPSVVEVNVLQLVDSRPQSLFEYFFGDPNQGDQRRSGLGSGDVDDVQWRSDRSGGV